jgi:hypothetical protein
MQAKKQWQDADKKVMTHEGVVQDALHVLDF